MEENERKKKFTKTPENQDSNKHVYTAEQEADYSILSKKLPSETQHNQISELSKVSRNDSPINPLVYRTVDSLNYYEEYCIDSLEKLKSITSQEGIIYQDIRVIDPLIELKGVILSKGHLNLSKNVISIGEIETIENELWANDSKIKVFNGLKLVTGDVNLRYSTIESLGTLEKVEGKLSLRDTPIKSLGNLTYVGGDLYLPIHFKEEDISNISVGGKVRYWKDAIRDEETYTDCFFAEFHDKEILENKRYFNGYIIARRNRTYLNSYVRENLIEYGEFLDTKLEELYGNNSSLFMALFNTDKNSRQLNEEFPVEFRTPVENQILEKYGYDLSSSQGLEELEKKASIVANEREKFSENLREKSRQYLEKNYNKEPLKKYQEALESFESDVWKERLKKTRHNGDISHSYYRNYFAVITEGNSDGFVYYINNVIHKIFFYIALSYQDDYRVEKGLPKIGEGWVSETELYHSIRDYFVNESVIHHGRPSWLGKQHVDIWIPKHNIGIEYQGRQHDQPIDFFGGEEAFKMNRKRDRKKKRLFKENKATLIEVRPGYDLKKVLRKIELAIQENAKEL